MQEVIDKIVYNRKLYWETGSSDISDSEYDQLLIELSEMNPDHELLQDVEEIIRDDAKKVEHKETLYSLNKIFSVEELGEWMSKVARNKEEQFLIEPKYDGLACRYYADTNQLVTRGDGKIGEDITHVLPIVKFSASTNIDFDPNMDIAGELVCKRSEFKNTSAVRSSGDKYKSERNLVAGVTNNDDILPFKGKIELTLMEYDTHKYIRTMDNIQNDWDSICSEFKENLDYPTDGLVIKLLDVGYSESLGNTAKFPRGQIALKFPDEIKEAKLLDVVFQMGKRKITPVAIIEPTVIDGVTIGRSTLHNAKFIISNDLMIGDTLKIIRSGQVIPKIVGSTPNPIEDERKSIIIDKCPSCGGEVEYSEPNILCTSDECGGAIRKQIQYAASVLGLDVLGPGAIDKIVGSFGSKTIMDIITLEYSDFMELDGFADVSAQKAEDALHKLISKELEDYKVFTCINAAGIGQDIWKKVLVLHYPDEVLSLSTYDLVDIDGIGDERAQVIENALEDNAELIDELLNTFNIIKSKDAIGGLPKVCFSGRFPHPKAYYAQIATRKGFDVAKAVTKNLKYLITDGAVTSKVSKAKQLGIQVITSDQFLAL